jgi:hypothetical protein
LVGKLAGKRLRGKSRRRWEDNIEVDVWELGWEVVDWIQLTQDRDWWQALVNTVMNLYFP